MAKVRVDGKIYPSKKNALREFSLAMICCDGSEGERMSYAYSMIQLGYNDINTYKEIAKVSVIRKKADK